MRLLVIEDEKKAGEYLKKGLEESGFTVDVVANGIDGLHQALEEDYDLLVLDVMLPGMDGWEVLRRLREKKDVPVLLLTAVDELEERVRGLELGGDDYLVKPFAFVELLARIRTLLRRGPPRDIEHMRIGDLEIDAVRRRVRRNGQRIDLTPREFSLLQLLARRRGEVLSRAQIASYVWDMNFDSDTNVVEVAIRRLRAKVDEGYGVKLIHTVRGMGYVLDDEREDA
ncbi:two component heavy metal response transcriptional regulator, winged helix family [Dyella jiangningensis]|uniref:heavy metal response regulator transcription factor n=1 Tax=Dyella sp. AtDHG13 TaxID=1938897 RepID=UPI00088E70EF|nr:heavy metal response regulator transcription factor [Dyella sp. AtDHG13]PXV55881.1 winged helix family two component heavy metal response transcriptional regulator [Dyella sp. AtDHG13]SDK52493.1 two component heavy metal response transcriptional regulator, winged helix family [Dyella jiangningensis]